MSSAVTVMRFRVSVPVLSEQITVTEPSVSTAGSLRISAWRLSMRWAPSESAIVTTAVSASGTAATARLTAVSSSSSMLLWPCSSPSTKTTATRISAAPASHLPSLSRRCCSGVCSCTTPWIIVAMWPSSVCMPVSVTTTRRGRS